MLTQKSEFVKAYILKCERFLNNYRLSRNYLAYTFHNGVFEDNFSDAVGAYDTRCGVLDRENIAFDVGVNVGIFKGKVGILHGAVFKDKAFAVAEGLSARNTAVSEGYVL